MKVLIISHTCCSTYNNMGKTFLSLFSGFRKEELCQLYIYPSLPDVDCCQSWFRVTDKQILKSLLTRRAPGGVVEGLGESRAFENQADAALYQRSGNSRPLARLLRDAMWRLSRWDSPQLRQWLREEKPEVIFLAPGYARFIYDIALTISRDYSLPIVTYICDEYYFVDPPPTLLGRWQLALLRRKMGELMEKTDCLVGICQPLAQAYRREFGVSARVIMTGARPRQPLARQPEGRKHIVYLGNLRPNRQRPLAEIAAVLARLNRELGEQTVLDVYTPETDPRLLGELAGIPCLKLHPPVSGEAFENVFRSADLLLHTEAFDPESVGLVRHSVSTKIADSLAGGIPLLAYGPACVASMAHLMENRCAFTATDPTQLEDALRRALTDPAARGEILENAAGTVRRFHDPEKNSLLLREVLRGGVRP